MQTVTDILARGFANKGCSVTTLTSSTSLSSNDCQFPYKIIRTSSLHQIYKQVKLHDYVLAQGDCYRLLLPCLLFKNKSFLLVHHMKVRVRTGIITRIIDRVFRWKFKIYAVSNFVLNSGTFDMNGVLNNPYNEILFNNSSKIEGRIRNFLHVGTRSSKGTWDLLFAFHKIVFKYPKAILTIIGSGSELDSLKSYVRANGLSNNVLFSGAVDENEMSYLMSIHQYVVVPSKVDEAFGLVVIEGLASGCRVICSDDGGLPEALGGMGLVFHKGNLEELQTLLENALDNVKNYSQDETTTIKKHLANYKSDSVVKNYLSVFEKK